MKHEILVSFGRKVQMRRKELKLSQEQLAEEAGLHRTYIGMIERAEKNVTLVNIEKIANAVKEQLNPLYKALGVEKIK